jgi:isobutyryl-CoA mutase
MESEAYQPQHPLRIVTATALFDGHDAAINIMRRILQDAGVEVVHLGHNRSVPEIVAAAIEEDVQAIAVSSYQGGHIEFFKYLIDLLKEKGAGHIKVFGGGGGVIVPEEISQLQAYGVARIYAPEDGANLGLQGIINDLTKQIDFPTGFFDPAAPPDLAHLSPDHKLDVARVISILETTQTTDTQKDPTYADFLSQIKTKSKTRLQPVIGITGTGGAGKSSLTDELILRLLNNNAHTAVAVVSCDPTRRKTGGALLGDRIRMNAIDSERVYLRSMATRNSNTEIPDALPDVINLLKTAGFDLIIVETAGIGQGDTNIVNLSDLSIYVMTSEFGAASQLEKIDMLDFADLIVINKYEKMGSEDAVKDVRKQVMRNRKAFDLAPEEMPVFGTIAAKFNDDGVSALYQAIIDTLETKTGLKLKSRLNISKRRTSSAKAIIIPPDRNRYLAEIEKTIGDYHRETENQAQALRKVWHLTETASLFDGDDPEKSTEGLKDRLAVEIDKARAAVSDEAQRLFDGWAETKKLYLADQLTYEVRGQKICVPLSTRSLARRKIPKIALPKFVDPGEILRFLKSENLPGYFPFTAGVFPLKRVDEDPTRMFAGEGDPARTNRRFKLLSAGYDAKRLSTAFDSVTLYGFDPEKRPDNYGKVGTAGVSVCTISDVSMLYEGFDLCAPNTSVSMTINGPGPMILAMFLNTAIAQQIKAFEAENGHIPDDEELARLRAYALSQVRGTVQADILKEDQGQNTCIFSIEFALRMMGDIQQFFIDQNVRNFYSVSISGYHIAEAGANPITQLAFTLANGFTYVEYYLSRGMDIDSFAPNLSFFFSNGMDPEYTVIGRVARRIWAIAMRDKYKASARSQKLKYHVQTSGRSLHSQEIQLNDIRTTLQALCALYDNCNSLHTNAFDEAITTPSRESVRRALAIQLIINREWGLSKNENPNQGSYIVEELTDLVEEAVLNEFKHIAQRGGVLGAMELGYQRNKIQEESMYYEAQKNSGEMPLIGVNTFRDPDAETDTLSEVVELARATEKEKKSQLTRLTAFQTSHTDEAPAALERLQQTALSGGNIFAEMMETVKVCSLGQITQALFAVGGKYRRNM